MGFTSIIIILGGLIVLVYIFPILYFLNLWRIVHANDLKISLMTLIGMKLRKIPPKAILMALIRLKKNEINNVQSDELEVHYLSGGDLDHVLDIMIAEKTSGKEPDFVNACVIDLRQKYGKSSKL